MPLFENNLSPYLTIVEATEPSAPAAGQQRLYIDSTTHLLKATNSSGTDRTIEGIAAGAITSSGLTQATARLLGRTTASTGAIEEITVGTGLSLSAGALTATGGSSTFVGCRAYNSALQALVTATITALTFDTEEYDTDAIHSTASNTSRFTVPTGKDGKWRFTGGGSYASNGSGDRYFWWRVNGSTEVHGGVAQWPPSPAVISFGAIPVTLALVATDYVELIGYQTSGGNLNVGNAGGDIKFQAFCEAQFLG